MSYQFKCDASFLHINNIHVSIKLKKNNSSLSRVIFKKREHFNEWNIAMSVINQYSS